MNATATIAHVAIPVWSIQATRDFYGGLLGCPQGRLTDTMVDFNFFGQHLVAHLASERLRAEMAVESTHQELLARHFGVITSLDEWRRIADVLQAHGTAFVMGPQVLHEGTGREEGLMFLLDPSRNALEFKGFNDPAQLSRALQGLPTRAPAAA